MNSGSYKRNVKKYTSLNVSVVEEATPECAQQCYEIHPESPTLHSLHESTPQSCSTSQSQDILLPLDVDDDPQTSNEDDSSTFSDGYYSPDEGCQDEDGADEESDSTLDLTSFMQKWSLDFNITHAALKPLLTRLSQYDHMLPEDPRRLLETPRSNVSVCDIQGGQYWHRGLGECKIIMSIKPYFKMNLLL